MSAEDERLERALAAHVEHLELGGPAPDVSHLTAAERERLAELVALLDQTQGVAFGRGIDETDDARATGEAATDAGAGVLATLREVLPSTARIASDPAATTSQIRGARVIEGWIVGTFGGRIRVWLLDADGPSLESNDEHLSDLARVFRLFPDTSAVALVGTDLACLLVQPEDCAPTIELPRGSLVPRRYRRPVEPVAEALPTFLRELMPAWEPVPVLNEAVTFTIDVGPIADETAGVALGEQIAAGARARKTNPKRAALTSLGDRETNALAALTHDIYDGRVAPDEIEETLRRLASDR